MKRTLFLLLFAMWMYNVHAQSSSPEVVASAGETYQASSMAIEWTLGELATVTIQNSAQQVTQGFHQPNYLITSVNELPLEMGQIRVYPNPTSDRIEIELGFNQVRNVRIQLFDLNGQLIWVREENGQQIGATENIGDLPSGTYFLNFFIDDNKHSQTFKIQKIN